MNRKDPSWYISPFHSHCILETRRKLDGNSDDGPDVPLRRIVYSNRTGSEFQAWCRLRDCAEDRSAGEISHRKDYSRKDPVRAYLITRLCSGITMEAVELKSTLGQIQLFLQGQEFGGIHEQKLPKPPGFIYKFFHTRRCWNVMLYGETIGSVNLRYPLRSDSEVLFQLNTSIPPLPILLRSREFHRETLYVIPPYTSIINDTEIETLHFIVAIVFRRLLLSFEYS